MAESQVTKGATQEEVKACWDGEMAKGRSSTTSMSSS